MKNQVQKFVFSTLLIFVNITCANAQTTSNDTITKISGEQIVVKIINTSEKDVTFSYPGETMTTILSKNLIREIVYSSGRKEKISEMVIISGEKDWEKVKLTTLTSDIEGLVKKGDLDARKTNLGPVYTPAKKTNAKLEKEIKVEAAKLGAHIVLLTNLPSSSTEFRLSGAAFGYK